MATKRKRTFLTLEQRLAAIKLLENGKSVLCVAQELGCGKTQIQECRKRKAELLADYESNAAADRKRRKTGSIPNEDLEQLLLDWIKARLPTICKDYEPRDIFNMDETGIFFKSGRRTTYCPSDVDCAGGKRAKNRITVALCASMTGEKLKPLVIGRSGKPRCFSRVKVEALPVTYRHNLKSWMNRRLFEEWLRGVDKKMRRQNRKILLFIDNASSHQHLELPNVKIVRLPANCTSVLQPMDQGIIQAFKLRFVKHQSRHILARMEKSTLSGTDLLKEITVLDTIYWVNKAWTETDCSCIMKCFNKCGFDFARNDPICSDSDSDAEDDDIPLAELARVESVHGCKLIDVVNMDIPTEETEAVDWDLPATELLKLSAESSDGESDSETEEPQTGSVCSLSEARDYIEKLKAFACEKGNLKLYSSVMDMSACLTEINISSVVVQKKISEFFK